MIAVTLLVVTVMAVLQGVESVPFLGGTFNSRPEDVNPSSRLSRQDPFSQLPPSLEGQGFDENYDEGPERPGFGNQGLGNQGFGNQGFGNQRPGNQGFGNQRPGNQGFGNQQSGNQGFGNQRPGNQVFGNQRPGNQGIGNQRPGNQGFGNQRPGNQGFGNQRPGNQGFGNQRPDNQGFGNQGQGGDEDGDDVFVFDRPTSGRPRPTTQRPTRATQRPTRAPQRPTTQTPTTQAAGGGATTPSACVRDCPTTGEFNPVCGTDRITYTNPGRLNCAASCGRSVSLSHYGTCITTTTSSTTARTFPQNNAPSRS